MALELNQELSNGVVTNYHRILSMSRDYSTKSLSVKVVSYLDKSKRTDEILQSQEIAHADDVRKQLDALVLNPTEENEAERQSLSEELNTLQENGVVTTITDRFVTTNEYKFDNITDDKTRADVYDMLVAEYFIGATKV